MRVLVVSDGRTPMPLILSSLQAAGIVAEPVESVEDARQMGVRYEFDTIVVIDGRLCDGGALDVIRHVRAAKVRTPILLLTDTIETERTVQAFALGADDVVSKSFQPSELIARLRALLRRNRGFTQAQVELGPLCVNLDSLEVWVRDTPVHLTSKEFSVLQLLVLKHGGVVPKETFFDHLYGGGDEPQPKVLDIFISRLRKKLAAAGADGMIRTVRGRGFSLCCPPTTRIARERPAAEAGLPWKEGYAL